MTSAQASTCPLPARTRAGGFEQEEHAAEAYDIAVLKCKGRKAVTNFGSDK